MKSSLGGPFLYLFFSFLVLAVTGGKVGSDSNYQLETAAVMVICATLALHSLDFFPHFYRRSTALVTLLILPVGVYAVNNVRVAGYALAMDPLLSATDRKSTRLNSSHIPLSRMPSSA